MIIKTDQGENIISINYFKKNWGFITVGFSILSGLFFSGLKIGSYEKSLDCKIEQIKFEQNCNEKIQQENKNCKDAEVLFYKSRVDELEKTIQKVRKNEK